MRQHHSVDARHFLAGFAVIDCTQKGVAARDSIADPSVRREPTYPEAIELYSSPREIRTAFQPTAVLNYTEEACIVSEPILWSAVRRKIARMGASGVVLPPFTDIGINETVLPTSAMGPHRSVVVYVPEGSARVRVTCGDD